MASHRWTPVAADFDGCEIQICYRNERDEEHVHLADPMDWYYNQDDPHALCWGACSGDWPACKAGCPVFAVLKDLMEHKL